MDTLAILVAVGTGLKKIYDRRTRNGRTENQELEQVVSNPPMIQHQQSNIPQQQLNDIVQQVLKAIPNQQQFQPQQGEIQQQPQQQHQRLSQPPRGPVSQSYRLRGVSEAHEPQI